MNIHLKLVGGFAAILVVGGCRDRAEETPTETAEAAALNPPPPPLPAPSLDSELAATQRVMPIDEPTGWP